jgi:5-dehydro-2-deoxygluconokinase
MSIDLLSVGRANLDLYSRDVGAAFEDITSFDAMVGGSPTNIAIGVARLGRSATILTAVGDDRTGDFVLRYLRDEQVDVSHVRRIAGKLTSLALLGVQPPDQFPLSFYREDPADIYVTAADVDAVPMASVRSLQVSGNALSRGSCASAARHALRTAREHGVVTYMDLDLRPTEWERPEDFGAAILDAASDVDVVIGTEDEFAAALLDDPARTMETRKVADGSADELASAVVEFLSVGPSVVIVKRGRKGASIVNSIGIEEVPGFPITVVNTVGAGDAFAAGLIRSRLEGLDWSDAVRFANACGAIVVTRHGCSAAFPTLGEVESFMRGQQP